MTLGRGEPIRVSRPRGRQAGEHLVTLDEAELIPRPEPVPESWAPEALAFASDLYAGVNRRVWGYDCCPWCGRENFGHAHLVLSRACAVRERYAQRLRDQAAEAVRREEAEAIDRYQDALARGLSEYEAREEGWPTVPAVSCLPEGVPCPPFEEIEFVDLRVGAEEAS